MKTNCFCGALAVVTGVGVGMMVGGCGAPLSLRTSAHATRAGTPTEVVFDAGGYSVDFEKSQAGSRPPDDAENCLRNGGFEVMDSSAFPEHWQADAYVWLPGDTDTDNPDPLAKLKPWMKWSTTPESPAAGSRSLSISIPAEAYKDVAGDVAGGEVCAYLHQEIALPAGKDVAMDGLLTYSYRGVVLKDVPGYRRLYVRVTFKGGPRNGKYAQSILNPHPGNRWLTGRLPFRAPPGTEALGVRLALTGGGEANFDATSLVCWAAPATEGAEPAAPGPKVRLVPASFLDNCYHLASGDPGTAIFGFDGEISAGEKCDLILQLPSGVALLALDPRAGILGVDKVSSATGERDQYRIDVGPWKKARNARFPFHQWGGLMVVLKTTLAPGDGPYPCPYWLEDDTGKHSRRVFDLRIVPPIEAAEAPKDFRSGGHWFLAQSIASEPAVSEVAALYRRVGFNSTHIPPCPLGDSLGKLGVERCTQPFTNAFTFPGEKPDDGVFRLADGSPLKQAICPSEVYLEGEYFTKKIKNG
ncbi:MAG: hypothetical protein HON70_14275, partial [Lentisphaerae bacterium]|nr:hypothetical protein [Lentisphaerota bacterium]